MWPAHCFFFCFFFMTEMLHKRKCLHKVFMSLMTLLWNFVLIILILIAIQHLIFLLLSTFPIKNTSLNVFLALAHLLMLSCYKHLAICKLVKIPSRYLFFYIFHLAILSLCICSAVHPFLILLSRVPFLISFHAAS